MSIFVVDTVYRHRAKKLEITERIAHFLDTGEVIAAKKVQKKSQIIGNITTDTEIEPNFVCSEKHRAFF